MPNERRKKQSKAKIYKSIENESRWSKFNDWCKKYQYSVTTIGAIITIFYVSIQLTCLGNQIKIISEQNQNISEQTLAISEQNKGKLDQTNAIKEQSSRIFEQTDAIIEQNQKIVDQTSAIIEQTEAINETNKAMWYSYRPIVKILPISAEKDIKIYTREGDTAKYSFYCNFINDGMFKTNIDSFNIEFYYKYEKTTTKKYNRLLEINSTLEPKIGSVQQEELF